MLGRQRSLNVGFTKKGNKNYSKSGAWKMRKMELIFNQIRTGGGGLRYERYWKFNFEYMKFKCLFYTPNIHPSVNVIQAVGYLSMKNRENCSPHSHGMIFKAMKSEKS